MSTPFLDYIRTIAGESMKLDSKGRIARGFRRQFNDAMNQEFGKLVNKSSQASTWAQLVEMYPSKFTGVADDSEED